MEKMDAHHHVCPKKPTFTTLADLASSDFIKLILPMFQQKDGLADPGKKQKMMLSNKSSSAATFRFFQTCKKNGCVFVFPTKKSYECDLQYLFPGRPASWWSEKTLPKFICFMVFVFSQDVGCHEYTILETTTDIYSPMFAVRKEEVLFAICHNGE